MTHCARRVLGLLLALCLAGCSHPRHEAVPAGATVLVLGDSLSFGTGANPGEDYPSLLAADTGWKIVNAGVPSDTTADGLARLPELLEQHTPRLVLVELGGNDFLDRLPGNQTEANLRAILTQIREKRIPAVLLAVPRPSVFGAAVGNLTDDPLFERIGDATGTPVVPDVLSEVLGKNALKSDPIHPNAAGYRKIGASLAETLRAMGFVR